MHRRATARILDSRQGVADGLVDRTIQKLRPVVAAYMLAGLAASSAAAQETFQMTLTNHREKDVVFAFRVDHSKRLMTRFAIISARDHSRVANARVTIWFNSARWPWLPSEPSITIAGDNGLVGDSVPNVVFIRQAALGSNNLRIEDVRQSVGPLILRTRDLIWFPRELADDLAGEGHGWSAHNGQVSRLSLDSWISKIEVEALGFEKLELVSGISPPPYQADLAGWGGTLVESGSTIHSLFLKPSEPQLMGESDSKKEIKRDTPESRMSANQPPALGRPGSMRRTNSNSGPKSAVEPEIKDKLPSVDIRAPSTMRNPFATGLATGGVIAVGLGLVFAIIAVLYGLPLFLAAGVVFGSSAFGATMAFLATR